MKASFSLNTTRKRHGLLIRAIAVFFLLFTSADISLPQYFCADNETFGLSFKSVPQAPIFTNQVGEHFVVASPASDSSAPDRPLPEAPREEDCFCCCVHVLPGLHAIDPFVLVVKPDHIPPKELFLPSPHLRETYHPPRSA